MSKQYIKIAVLFLMMFFIPANSFCKNKHNKSFNKYFTLADTISFNIDSLLIGSISDVIVLGGGKYVIKDPIAFSALWIDTENKIYRKLSVQKELPGVNEAVISVYKDPHGGFWVAIHDYYVKFNNNGNLLSHHRNNKYFVSDKFCIDSHANLIVYCRQDKFKDVFLLHYNLVDNNLSRMFELGFSENYINAIKRFDGGGLLIDKDNYLYAANAIENKIYKYSLSGNLEKCFKSKYVPFKYLDKDILPGKAGVIDFLSKTRGKIINTTINKMGFINNEFIFVEYLGPKGRNVEIFSTDGDVVNLESITLPEGFRVVGSANGCMYFKNVMLEADEKPDEIKNPVLLKYRFNE